LEGTYANKAQHKNSVGTWNFNTSYLNRQLSPGFCIPLGNNTPYREGFEAGVEADGPGQHQRLTVMQCFSTSCGCL